jgi:predicted RNA-binding Zn ribbon-like protein
MYVTILTVAPAQSGVNMMFAHDTEAALVFVAALVNSAGGDVDELADHAGLTAFLDAQQISGLRAGTPEELDAVRALRPRLEAAWNAEDEAEVVAIVNQLFAEAAALPRVTRHDGWDWHLHLTSPDAPLVDRLGTEAAMGIADLVRAKDLDRLRRCAAPDCDAVLVDLSKNRSRRYCDTGNCANRAHVAAYRARKARGG